MKPPSRAERLSALARRRTLTREPAPSPAPASSAPHHARRAAPLVRVPGVEVRTSCGVHWKVTSPALDAARLLANGRPPNGVLPESADKDLQLLAGRTLRDVVFFDLETCGFAGNPVFLVGALDRRSGPPKVRQFFARTYREEASILEGALDWLNQFPVWVSFNGKSYDLPFLRDRLVRHCLPLPMPEVHVDLMHPSRRKWKKSFPNCRLQTLERYLWGRERYGDISGRDIPAFYHAFVQGRRTSDLVSVLRHNREDLQTLDDLLADLFSIPLGSLT